MDVNRRFNLTDEPWIPVTSGRISLREVFSRPNVTDLSGNPLEKIALLKFLQAIAQAARTPRDNAEWAHLGTAGLAEACLAYLEKWHDAFWLYGPAPFLQFPAVARAKLLPYGGLLPNVATGNTTILFQSQKEQPLDDAQKALLLLVTMSCCFSGKKVDKSVALSPGYTKGGSAKAGPALCALGLLHSFLRGRSLLETVWLNLLTQEQITQDIYQDGVGVPPWEVMPQGEVDDVATALTRCLMGRLVPMARFCLLEEEGLHYVEGIRHPDYLQGGMVDPSVTGDRSAKKPRMIWADPQKRPWRQLTSLLGFLRHEQNAAMRCLQLSWCLPRLASGHLKEITIWAGGIRVRSNAGEQYLSGSDDVVESEFSLPVGILGNGEHSDWFLSFQEAMNAVDGLGRTVYASVAGYYREQKAESGTGLAERASLDFWQQAEGFFPALVDACGQQDASGQQDPKAREDVVHRLRGCVLECYSRACPQETARQLALWARHRPFSG